MAVLDDHEVLNMDALLDLIYSIQTDLQILTDALAREREPDVSSSAFLNLACLQDYLHQSMPSLNRH